MKTQSGDRKCGVCKQIEWIGVTTHRQFVWRLIMLANKIVRDYLHALAKTNDLSNIQ